MANLALKLIVTPLLVAIASLAGRRWGPAVSGWLVALPLTSGPIVFFLSLAPGERFAAGVAGATLAGAVSQALFCLVYSRLAIRRAWSYALFSSILAFLAGTIVLQRLALPIVALFVVVVLLQALAIRLMPPIKSPPPQAQRAALPPWDIPARMALTTLFVLLLTGSATALGPQLTGLLAPFPLYGTILAVFAHRQSGAHAAVQVLRGLLFGLFSFAGFFLALALLLGQVATGSAFGAAIAVALTVQAGTLRILGRPPRTTGADMVLEQP